MTAPALVRSFDVFDTVLTRRIGDPVGVLRLVAERAAEAGLVLEREVAGVALARRRVEQDLMARRSAPVVLAEVWREVATSLSRPASWAQDLLALEEQLERDLCVPVPGIADELAAVRRELPRPQVVFVSDTPHRPTLLRELLDRAGVLQPEDRVYCSAELGASKAQGQLFDLVTADLGVDPGAVLHVGDDALADVAAARLQSWRSRARPQARLDRYERAVERHGADAAGLAPWLAGSSRLARLEAEQDGLDGGIAKVAAGVAAPLMLGYALWLAGQARLHGLRRLYFVARDGEVLLQVARPVLARLAPEVECRYLHASRQAWEFAGLAGEPTTLAAWARVDDEHTPRDSLARVGLTPEDVHAQEGLAVAAPGVADRLLTRSERDVLTGYLQRPDVRERVLAASAAQSAAAVAYLRSVGLGDDLPSALVDVGWRGHMAGACDTLLRAGGLPRVRHLFLGVSAEAHRVRARPVPPDLTGWLFDEDRGRGVASASRLSGLTTVVEVFCSGAQGRVARYADDGTPELTVAVNEPVVAWGLHGFRRAVLRTVELCVPHLRPEHAHADLSALAVEVLDAFWRTPDDAEVRAWGAFPWEDEARHDASLAEPVRGRAVFQQALRGGAGVRRRHSWRAGTAQVSGQPWRALLRLRALQVQHEDRVRRVPRRVRLELAVRRRRR